MEALGTVPRVPPGGDGPGGLQRRWERLGLLPLRARTLPDLPLGRGRTGRNLRPVATPLLRDCPVERSRPFSEGTSLRARQQRREPRRGREGVLVAARFDAHPLLHALALPVSSIRVSLPASIGGEPLPGSARARVR